jgi:trans-aconitate 2-methyltransferase
MLDAARLRLPDARFVLADIADVPAWQSALGESPALLFANAALQWVPDHRGLLPRLMNALCPGGVLAVQMPDNRDEDTHRLMREVAARPAYAPFTGTATQAHTPLLGVQGYYDLLAPLAADVDVWHTIYQHPMADAAAIVQWLSSTGLRPFVDGMPPDVKAAFLADYTREIDRAYGVRSDGKRLMAFPRLFIVARKAV